MFSLDFFLSSSFDVYQLKVQNKTLPFLVPTPALQFLHLDYEAENMLSKVDKPVNCLRLLIVMLKV